MKILVTGCAGFIGSHVCEKLLKDNTIKIYGIDNLNDYYNVSFKKLNIKILKKYSNFTFFEEDVCNTNIITEFKPDKICHLASYAGVRYSIENPKLYVRNNIEGFIHILEECVKNKINKIIYASSSSVYGLNKKIPFKETDKIEKTNSPYAVTKLSMELFAKTYYQLYNIKSIGLRFFTVYGPRGRPDMAPFKFLNAIENGMEFEKYGDGNSSRDYTYIDDIVEGIIAALFNNDIGCEIYNLGNSKPVTLNKFINLCEKVTGEKAKYIKVNEKLGDVPHTCADISKAKKDLNYFPKTELIDGLEKTLQWIKTNL